MNWENWTLLVEDLKQLPPERFNYGTSCDARCGCVAVQVFVRTTGRRDGCHVLSAGVIRQFLEVSYLEAQFIYGDCVPELGPGETLYDGWGNGPRGAEGISEALRRLSVVAARYGGPPAEQKIEVQTSAPVPTQAQCDAFLQSIRDLGHQTTRVEQES